MAHEIEARLENLGRVGASFMTWSPWADGLCQDVSVKRLVEKHEHVLRVTTPPPSCSEIDSGNFKPRPQQGQPKNQPDHGGPSISRHATHGAFLFRWCHTRRVPRSHAETGG